MARVHPEVLEEPSQIRIARLPHRLHPSQSPGNALGDETTKRLLEAVVSVCATAVEVNAESDRFPAEWIFHKRWGKVAGKINGQQLQFETVGGRTSCFVPALQIKVGSSTTGRRKRKEKEESEEEEDAAPAAAPPPPAAVPPKQRGRGRAATAAKAKPKATVSLK